MTTLGILLQQIKEKEEHDLAYVKKIKEVETLLKAEQDNLKKLKSKKKKLSEEIKIKQSRCSEKVITEVMFQHQKHILGDLFEEAQTDLKEQETILDQLQQSVCLNRMAFYSDIKVFLGNYKLNKASKYFKNNTTSLHDLSDTIVIKIEKEEEEDEYAQLIEEMLSLEKQLEEIKAEEIQIEEAKRLKVKLEAEPSCGEEFMRDQKLLKETKENLKKVEEEVISLKTEIAQKEILLLNKRPNLTEVNSVSNHEEKSVGEVQNEAIKTPDVSRSNVSKGNLSISKTVTFKNDVEMKTISPMSQNKIVLKSKNRTKSPSPALRKKLTQQLTSKLDESMRDILFRDKM